MDKATAANATPVAGSEAPQEVSNPETSTPSTPEAAPTSKDAAEDGAHEEGVPPAPAGMAPDKEEEIPFHKRPEFQRLSRQNRRLADHVESQSKQLAEALEAIKELTALQKGEEYTPKAATPSSVDYDALIDREMEALSSTENLSPSEEAAVIAIAKEYAIENGEERIPLPLVNALKIYRKFTPPAPEAKAPEPAPTKEEKVPVVDPTPPPKTPAQKNMSRKLSNDPMQDMWRAIAEAKAAARSQAN